MLKSLMLTASASVLALSAVCTASASAAELQVVASFSIIADLAHNVGGDRVAITTLVGTDGDAHVYEPKPADAVSMDKADVVLVNGLGFEGFLARLVETSGTKARVVVVSRGVEPLKLSQEPAGHAHPQAQEAGTAEQGHKPGEHGHDHDAVDPHAWQSIANAKLYVENIADAFCQADKAGCVAYTANAQAYLAKLETLESDVKTAIAAIAPEKRVIITSHDAFGYFEQAYGLQFLAPEGISTESEASAADVATLVDQVKRDKASAIFVENISDERLIKQIAAETGLKVGGTLYSDALSATGGPAATYINMISHNVETIAAAIQGS
ncbi:MAG: zinc ABC transporter substrate-binding protein AztC [Allorhizobium sp.]